MNWEKVVGNVFCFRILFGNVHGSPKRVGPGIKAPGLEQHWSLWRIRLMFTPIGARYGIWSPFVKWNPWSFDFTLIYDRLEVGTEEQMPVEPALDWAYVWACLDMFDACFDSSGSVLRSRGWKHYVYTNNNGIKACNSGPIGFIYSFLGQGPFNEQSEWTIFNIITPLLL